MTKIYELLDGKRLMADVDENHHTATVSVYALDDLVKEVNKTGHWIPVSERLPEENVEVLVTIWGVVEIARHTKEYGWEWLYEAGTDYWEKIKDVIAWMPLPQPYKADKED